MAFANYWLYEEHAKKAPYKYPVQKKLKIDHKRLGACMALSARESLGDKLYVSKDEMNLNYAHYPFFLYLSANKNRRRYETGKELMLRDWVMDQPDNSVDIVSIFTASVELHDGNMWNALLAIHELLRNEGRYFDKTYYFYESTIEKEIAFFNKFVDIRGDLRERGTNFKGDHIGTWYRMWGMMLYRLQFVNEKLFDGQRFLRGVRMNAGRVLSFHMGWGAEMFKYIKHGIFQGEPHGGDKDKRKVEINIKAEKAIGSMVKALFYPKKMYSKLGISKESCQSRVWLKHKK
jgi:hypothetical protein